MEIHFAEPREETVYDNHGCPAATDYLLDFKVDNVSFRATYRNGPYGFVHFWSQSEYIGELYNSGYGDIKSFICGALSDHHSVLYKAFHDIKGDALEELREKLTRDILAADFCD